MVFLGIVAGLLACSLVLVFWPSQGDRPADSTSRPARDPGPWPQVPVSALSLFHRQGRINALTEPGPANPAAGPAAYPAPSGAKAPPATPKPLRVADFDEAQDLLVVLVEKRGGRMPRLDLRLSPVDGKDWTEVLVDGQVLAQVPTARLTSPQQVALLPHAPGAAPRIAA